MRQRQWLELLSDYDCNIHYHPRKENVMAGELSRKERVEPLRVRALVMTIDLDLPKLILEAQFEALKPENLKNEDRIQAAQDRQKSYIDLKRKPMEFKVEDRVRLKVSPWKGVVRFGKRVMSFASSAITYTIVYTNSEPQRPVAPPSPNYIPGLEEPQTPPVSHDEDEQDEHMLPAKDQPLPPVDAPTAESPGYVAKSNPEEDPEEYKDDESEDGPVDYPIDGGDDGDDDDGDSSRDEADDEDEDEEDEVEEEEHLDSADSTVVIPTVELVTPPEGTEPTLRMASTQALIDTITAALPSPPLLPLLYIPPPVDCRDDVLETEMPPRKRSCLSTLCSRYEIGESSIARPTRGREIDYGFVSTLDAEVRRRGIGDVGYGIRDTWVDLTEVVSAIAPMTLGEASGTDGRDSLSDGRHKTRDGDMQAELLALREQIMAPVTTQGPNIPPNNTNPNNMTLESVQAMIDQALLRNSTNGDKSHSSHEDNRRNVKTPMEFEVGDRVILKVSPWKGSYDLVSENEKEHEEHLKAFLELLKKEKLFDWGEKEESGFQLIKQKFCSAPILDLPEESEEFVSIVKLRIRV
nr:reverse transcriptase domain-containing protein [Tanacetum cinerariifolium]